MDGKLSSMVAPILAIGALCAIFVTSAQAVDGKKGWAGGNADQADSSNSYWYYHWWHTKPAGADQANSDWIPLVKYPNNLQTKLDIVTGYDDVDTILVLNEPERADQSDVTVAEAISIWPQFEATGLNLITPAISDNAEGRAWLSDFMSQANANNYRMDGLAFHWYGGSTPNATGAANNFLSRVDHYWNTYGLPLWITEFTIHDWGGNYTDQEILDANEQFLDIVLPELESRTYVEAYSYYQHFDDALALEDVGGLWTPTNVGDVYAPSYSTGEIYDIDGQAKPEEYVHLKGGALTNNSTAVNTAVHTIYAINGDSTLSGSADWGVSGAGAVEINAGATLQKTGSNTTRVLGAPVNNRGLLRVTAGTLGLQGGSDLLGTGTTRLEPGAKISLGAAADRDGVVLGQSLELNGGTLEAKFITDGTHIVSGTAVVNQDTTFSGDGLLFVNAPLVKPVASNGGGIIKDDTGTVLLNTANTYAGDTVVRQGTLRLNPSASIANSPRIEVQAGASLDVSSHTSGFALAGQTLELHGQVVGPINASNNAQVMALSSAASLVGNLTVNEATVVVGGAGFNENTAAPSPVTTGLVLNFDASADAPGDATWNSSLNAADSLAFGGAATPTVVSNAAFPGITASYDIDVTGGATGLNNFFEQEAPQLSRRDATFEVVFYVSDTAAGAEQVLFEVGATRGVSFTLSDDQLSFNVDGDGALNTLNTTLAPGWHHAVGVIDVVGLDDNLANDSIELFLNNSSIGVMENLLIDDWAGGNISGLGANASGAAGTAAATSFHGEIAAARFYADQIFGTEEVAQNYASLTALGEGEATTMRVEGDYSQSADGTLALDLLSPAMYDKLEVIGQADLEGSLVVSELAEFDPNFGDAFTVLSTTQGIVGEFESLTLPALESGQLWIADYTANELVLTIAGSIADFDFDGDVDQQDLAVWQTAYGISAAGDADGDGDTDATDYLIWQRESLASAASLANAAAVPEPMTTQLIACAMILASCQTTRRGRIRIC